MLLIAHIANLHNEISSNKSEFTNYVADLKIDLRQSKDNLDALKEKVMTLEQFCKREKFQELEENIGNDKGKLAALEIVVSSTKEELDRTRQENKDLTKQMQEIREKIIVFEKKDDVNK